MCHVLGYPLFRCRLLKLVQLAKGSIQIKNFPKSGKSPKGGGSATEIKKSTIQNVDFLIRGGEGHILTFFPNVNADFKYFS